jgi:TRAP-type transport system periplasmic protein
MVSSHVQFAMTMVVAACIGATGCGAAADKAGGAKPVHAVVLHVLNTRAIEEVQPFIDKLVELSKGALRLEGQQKWGRGSTTSDTDAIRAVQAGKADLAIVSVRAWHDLGVRSFDALIAPQAVDSMALQQKVLDGDLPPQMLAGLKPSGLTGIGLLPGPMRKPAGITRSLLAPADYQGARIAFGSSAVADRALRALGAIPVASAFEGTAVDGFDGIEQQVASVSGNAYDGTVRTITENVNLWPKPMVVVAGATAIHRLSDRQLGWLTSAARDSVDATAQAQMKADTDGLPPMCRRGGLDFVTATAQQVAQLRSAFQPVDAWLRQDRQTARLLDEIATLRAGGVRAFPQESMTCTGIAAAGGATRAVTPIDGIYEVSYTATELIKAGSFDAPPQNYGTFRLILNRGRWEQTQRSDKADTWTIGHYTLSGDVLTTTVDAGGGNAPGGAVDKPGDGSSVRWSRYRDQLSLRPLYPTLDPADYPLGWTIKPWRRLGDAESPT